MDKSQLTEQDNRTKFITPAIEAAGWDLLTQLREEFFFTKGRIVVRGKTVKRGRAKKADYILSFKPGIPIAIVEARDNNHPVGGGMLQALEYGETLNVPFVFSCNGDAFLFHDRTPGASPKECEIPLDEFPGPADLWHRYCHENHFSEAGRSVVEQEFHSDGSGKSPRYYQLNAINRTIEAIARGQDRILLVMATGTGKTYTAFQIIWRLWKSRTKRRILFLADRNILVDQTRTNDFKPLGSAMTKITNRKIDKSYEVYLALYQAITGPEDAQKVYRDFSPDFFDLILIDECHRGSAAEDSAWREILEYFSTATQIGMTATPKETKYVSNINYFGEPVYQYSLKQGIEDGFLAPYKVIRIDFDKDLQGWRPTATQTDRRGEQIEDRIYNQKDFDRSLVLDERTKLVAKKVTEFLQGTDRYAKTIVFCEDIEHAERMRQALVNQNADLVDENPRYVVRITGDNPEGKPEFDHFIDPESRYPVIATTSKLMTTGVDAQTCKLVVLDQCIQSMTEFKQMIGRGTRINEDYGKMFFTIMDFRKATELFADPAFDGDPVQVYEPKADESVVPPDEADDDQDISGEVDSDGFPVADEGADAVHEPGVEFTTRAGKRRKYYVDGVPVRVVGERVQYMGPDGKLIVESLRDYTRTAVRKEFASLDDFLKRWSEADRKQAIVEELDQQGVFFEALADEVGRDCGPFDLICHVAFGQPPLTRRERAENVKKRDYFTKYGNDARDVLQALLDKYADEGIDDIESMELLKVQPLSSFGTPLEIVKLFGTKQDYLRALKDLESQLYGEAG